MAGIAQTDANIDAFYAVSAGKFRRYHSEGWRQIFDWHTQLLNIRDGFRVIHGLCSAWLLLGKLKPDMVFTRGGYVSVPVALAAKLRHVPYLTHDSDVIPSLANRIIAPWAVKHAVATDSDNYPYPKHKLVTVGVPVSEYYQPVDHKLLLRYRRELNIQDAREVICVTGGGNGAQKLNEIVLDNALYLLKRYPKLMILHIAGRSQVERLSDRYDAVIESGKDRARVRVEGFVNDLYRYSGAADIVIARGGATNLAEFAVQGKACIIIPSKQLKWNVRNAQAMANEQAIIALDEEAAEQELRLAHLVINLLDNNQERLTLQNNLASFANPEAARDLANLLLQEAKQTAKPRDDV